MKLKLLMGLLALAMLFGCAPEVGSDAWCQQMKEKPKGEWTADATGNFAKHCLF